MAFLSRWLSYPGPFDRENDREYLNWRLYTGGALMKVADSVISTIVQILIQSVIIVVKMTLFR